MSAFIKGIRLAASMTRVLLLIGDRQHDRFLLQTEDTGQPSLVDLAGVLQLAFPGSKLHLLDPAALPDRHPAQPVAAALRDLKQNEILLIDGELLFEDPGHPRDQDFAMLRNIESFSRAAGKDRGLLCIRTQRPRAMPQVLGTSPMVSQINIPPTSRDERKNYAALRCKSLPAVGQSSLDEVALLLSNLTDDWRLGELENLIRFCTEKGINSRTGIESSVRAISMGVSDSPWTGDVLAKTIKRAPELLGKRVRGQPAALSAVCAALKKAATGLAGAHQGSLSRGPRAKLFFAGPTGTGKTEMAKALAELVFGDESAIIRFDCAEFRQEHTVARLIGAPPGYIGFESGGELTERVRSRPHSVILFDEIEKAHPRLLDIFLSILDDGRLTDGQGVTTHFDESILVFTSNLGIYREQDDGRGGRSRTPRFTLQATISEITREVRAAIREEFVSNLGRPELLGRLGGEREIIVFDFLRDVKGVVEKFIDRLVERITNLHGVQLTVDSSVIEYLVREASTPESLILGARGLGQTVDSIVITPLAELLCDIETSPRSIMAIMNHDGRIGFTTSS